MQSPAIDRYAYQPDPFLMDAQKLASTMRRDNAPGIFRCDNPPPFSPIRLLGESDGDGVEKKTVRWNLADPDRLPAEESRLPPKKRKLANAAAVTQESVKKKHRKLPPWKSMTSAPVLVVPTYVKHSVKKRKRDYPLLVYTPSKSKGRRRKKKKTRISGHFVASSVARATAARGMSKEAAVPEISQAKVAQTRVASSVPARQAIEEEASMPVTSQAKQVVPPRRGKTLSSILGSSLFRAGLEEKAKTTESKLSQATQETTEASEAPNEARMPSHPASEESIESPASHSSSRTTGSWTPVSADVARQLIRQGYRGQIHGYVPPLSADGFSSIENLSQIWFYRAGSRDAQVLKRASQHMVDCET